MLEFKRCTEHCRKMPIQVHTSYSKYSEESELIIKLKGMVPDGKIPRGLLLEGRPAIKDAIAEFDRAKELDKRNEMRPAKKSKAK